MAFVNANFPLSSKLQIYPLKNDPVDKKQSGKEFSSKC